jgi:hypothetical protein
MKTGKNDKLPLIVSYVLATSSGENQPSPPFLSVETVPLYWSSMLYTAGICVHGYPRC